MKYRITIDVEVTDPEAVIDEAKEVYDKGLDTVEWALVELFANTPEGVGDPDGCHLISAEAKEME